ncbi:hypothetical protein [Herbaspirillum rhizosphaerae]|uniref:hypothetical protein n=1 Tax=Herbaspirillum rhizosphaerae TaxID=346179 RepID=UPI00067C5360|nr:hypothetical protein [Herbaspirillum rhizosphaerae]
MGYEDKLLYITPDMVLEAQENPKGWIYKIDEVLNPGEYASCSSVIGAWKVDSNGLFTGEVILNPKYRPH